MCMDKGRSIIRIPIKVKGYFQSIELTRRCWRGKLRLTIELLIGRERPRVGPKLECIHKRMIRICTSRLIAESSLLFIKRRSEIQDCKIKHNSNRGASSKVLPESAGKKLPKTMLRKSGEQPTAGYSYHGQKSRNNENVRGSGSHGPVVGKSANYYNSAGAAAPQRSSNMKSYATLEQLNYKHSMGLKHGASKGQLQSGPGYKKPGAKVYMQSNYNYRGKLNTDSGMGSSMGHHFPTSSASQLQSALFQSYMKPGSQGSRIDLKSGGEKRKTISSGNRTGIESYTTSVKQQTRKKPSETDKLSMLKPVGIATEKYARSTFGR